MNPKSPAELWRTIFFERCAFQDVVPKMLRRKSWFLASPNPFKIHPKSIQNRCSRTSLISYAIVAQTFDIFKRRNLENINFPLGKSMFFRFSRKACLCGFRAFFLPKIIPKPFQNEVQTLQKSMPKTCWFSTSIFWGFGLDLGGSWASKMEPSWPFWPQKISGPAHFCFK